MYIKEFLNKLLSMFPCLAGGVLHLIVIDYQDTKSRLTCLNVPFGISRRPNRQHRDPPCH